MIPMLAFRYSFSRMNRHFWRSVRIAFSLAFSTAAMMVVLSVMDYLQEERLSAIKDVKSFELVVRGASCEDVASLYPSCTVFPYSERMALVDGHAMNIRYVDPQSYDGGLELLAGDFSQAVIPYRLYLENGFDDIDVSTIAGGTLRDLENRTYGVSGVYSTRLGSSFDPYHVFLPSSYAGEGGLDLVAIKGSDDAGPLEKGGYDHTSWKESESTLYSAFMLERFMMVFVLSFLFLIVFFQIRQETRVFLEAKRKERVELYVMGLGGAAVGLAFVLSFAILVAFALLSGLAVSVVLLEVFSSSLSSLVMSHVSFSLSWSSFAVISFVMLFLSALSCAVGLYRERSLSPLEVLDGR